MKYCAKCGNELIDEAIVCTKCGCMVEAAPQVYKPKPVPQKYSAPAAPVTESNVSWVTLAAGIFSFSLLFFFLFDYFTLGTSAQYMSSTSVVGRFIVKTIMHTICIIATSSIAILTGYKSIASKKAIAIIGFVLGIIPLFTIVLVAIFGIRI